MLSGDICAAEGQCRTTLHYAGPVEPYCITALSAATTNRPQRFNVLFPRNCREVGTSTMCTATDDGLFCDKPATSSGELTVLVIAL